MVAVVLFAVTSSQAQTSESHSSPIKFSVAANIGAPISTPSIFSISYGADIQADFGIGGAASITGSVGYQNFKAKSSWGGGNGYYIPLLVGTKFSLGNDKFYGHAQLGYAFAQGGGGGFTYAPSIGYNFSPNFDASLKYLAFSNGGTVGTLGVRLAYSF